MEMMDIKRTDSEDQKELTSIKLVEILEKQKPVRKKPPSSDDGSSVLVLLRDKANQEGLNEEQITRLVNVATSKKYSDAVVNQIIKCLIPRDGVNSDCIVHLISKMCSNVISVNIQVSFLKWFIMVYEWINDKETVHCLYGMLFLFLDNDALCPYICHALYSMTRKEDVKPFRLRKLLDLLGKVGQQPHLIGLLSLYKAHVPHLVSVNIPKIKKAFFKRKDTKWLDVVWSIKQSRTNSLKETSYNLDKAVVNLPAAKRRRKDIIIPASYGDSQNITEAIQNMRISFDQITSFKDFLSHVDKLEFPSQMGCILKSRYLQHLLMVTQNEAAIVRLNCWLQQAFDEELVSAPSGVTRERVTTFLEALLNFVSFYQKPLSCLETSLAQYLLTWNGIDYQTLIFLLVSQLQIKPFQKLNDFILEPLRKLFFCSSVEFKCQVLSCFTELLLTFARSTLTTSIKEDQRSQSTSASPLSVNDVSESDKETQVTNMVIKDFIGFVNNICSVALQIESDHILLQHCILCFFEQVSVLQKHYPAIQFVFIPSPAIIYRLLFASNAMTLSRLCNLIVNYKEAFEFLKRAGTNIRTDDVLDGFEYLDRFNQYIIDIADTIWRNKAFEDRSKSLCYSVPRPITDALEIPHLNERFSIVNHVALVGVAKKFLLQTQEEGMKLNPSLIRGKTRTVYLEFLNRQNIHGVVRFLNTFIKQKV